MRWASTSVTVDCWGEGGDEREKRREEMRRKKREERRKREEREERREKGIQGEIVGLTSHGGRRRGMAAGWRRKRKSPEPRHKS